MFKKSKILVLGGTGLLGSSLIKVLNENGYKNVLYPGHNELNLLNPDEVLKYFKANNPEYVFCAAGKVGGIIDNKTYPVDYLNINLKIQTNCFESAHLNKCKTFVFYGSSCAYPKNLTLPIKEDSLLAGKIEETSEAYALAKISGIIACKSYNIQYPKGCRFIALIPCTMFGPNDNFNLNSSHVISALIRKFYEAKKKNKDNVMLWGSGKPRREFIFSEDIAYASIFAVKFKNKMENTHYNIGSGFDTSIKSLAKKIVNISGFKGSICWNIEKPDGTYRKLLNSDKFKNLGWRPKFDFDNALKLTYNWFSENFKPD